jgi:5'-phosphate synthase pdxT subunit
MELKIGVLAVQGGVSEHENALLKCLKQNGGVLSDVELKVCRVTQASDVSDLDGLVIPGGESSVNSQIMDDAIMEKLCTWANDHRHVLFGTCAGLITLSKSIENSMAGQQDRFSKVNGFPHDILISHV